MWRATSPRRSFILLDGVRHTKTNSFIRFIILNEIRGQPREGEDLCIFGADSPFEQSF
jgi:hypothetical protein